MKRTDIQNLTPQEATDEFVLMSLSRLLRNARKAQKNAEESSNMVYQVLEDMCIDLGATSRAENAENLNEAISCYILYGEYTHKDLLSEIREQYARRE
jgi:hypothetical protein